MSISSRNSQTQRSPPASSSRILSRVSSARAANPAASSTDLDPRTVELSTLGLSAPTGVVTPAESHIMRGVWVGHPAWAREI